MGYGLRSAHGRLPIGRDDVRLDTSVARFGASERPRGLLVAIHDVAPPFERELQLLWELCRQAGHRPALLVVPNWHGQWPLARSLRLVRWIQRCAAEGADLFLHGERHDEQRLPRSIRDRWRAWGRTNGEGEFLTLDAAQAEERMLRGLSVLRSLDLQPLGFVPPAWLARESTHTVVRSLGLSVSEDDRTVRLHDPVGARSTPLTIPVLRWSGRSAFRATASHVVSDIRWYTQRHLGTMRLALHPQDLYHGKTALSVRLALTRWSRSRVSLSYRTLA